MIFYSETLEQSQYKEDDKNDGKDENRAARVHSAGRKKQEKEGGIVTAWISLGVALSGQEWLGDKWHW